MRPIIRIKNLSKKFGKQVVIDNLNLEVFKGEFFGLLGPNGAGKTVLINHLLGIILATKGRIWIFGKPLYENLSFIHSRINFSSNYSQVQLNATILENLLTFARLYGVKNPQEKIFRLLKLLELEQYAKRKVRARVLSSGEMTRLMLVKALLNDPKILFLDEPTANLDPAMAQKIRKYIKKLHQEQQVTIFYTSHNLEEVRQLCTRIAFLKEGRLFKIIENKKDLDPKKLLKFYQ